MKIIEQITQELSLNLSQVKNTVDLLLAENTIPFIARYRKEATDNLDEVQIAQIQDRYTYLQELEERREVILESIRTQEKLTPELEKALRNATTKQQLEDLYLPYKPKRRTRATIAKEKGLEPLAHLLLDPGSTLNTLKAWLQSFNEQQETPLLEEEAFAGAKDIVAEWVSEDAALREELRVWTWKSGVLTTKVKSEHEEKSTKFDMYYDFKEAVCDIPPHRYLAIRRGEKEGILRVAIEVDETSAFLILKKHWLRNCSSDLQPILESLLQDAYARLLAPAIETDIRLEQKNISDESSIELFAKGLRQLLLHPPGGARIVLGLDPGFRTGTKWVVIDHTGKFVDNGVIYPVEPQNKVMEAQKILRNLIETYKVNIICIGNGTASREVQQFVKTFLSTLAQPVEQMIVNESGASVYSASQEARDEFPDLDLTVRGAISIARRYQDPLAELVKIDPKSIGVGQYQHDVNQTRLKQSLDRTVESCVNYVGVDLNRASVPLLSYVSGITKSMAKRIVAYRDQNGGIHTREELKAVSGLGPKTFQQAAGFLRITEGTHPLDRSAVHPENYNIVERMAQDLKLSVEEIIGKESLLQKIDLKQYQSEDVGLYTLKDIIEELRKPGRDPRQDHQSVQFDESVQTIQDLKVGMRLNGSITNITHFGAFVDIGVHQDGLVHISELSDKYIKDPMEVCAVGQHVSVTVKEVDIPRNRIALSMKSSPHEKLVSQKKSHSAKGVKDQPKPSSAPEAPKVSGNFNKDLSQLMSKFNR
ncbi:Tex family protein [Deltaproteobacteria bacterium TL4]